MIELPFLPSDGELAFPHPSSALRNPDGLLAMGGNLHPATLLKAYSQGIFPWFSDGEPILWWSPEPRLVFDSAELYPGRRMRRWLAQCPWTLRADSCFEEVIHACAQPRAHQPGTWITAQMQDAYIAMHRLGHAHSVEVFEDQKLIGGIYGIAIGRVFFGESMFSLRSNASKVALWALAAAAREWQMPLIDAQVRNAHLLSLGAIELPRERFLAALDSLCRQEAPVESWAQQWPVEQAARILSAATGFPP